MLGKIFKTTDFRATGNWLNQRCVIDGVVKSECGQSLVILAISFLVLLFFIGLVTDAASVYISYTQLKRAVDAASVAAANNVKITTPGEDPEVRKQKVTAAAREMLSLHNISDLSSLEVYLCDDADKPADFASMCPASMNRLAN